MKRFLLLSGYGLILLFMACSPGNKVSIEDHNLSDSLDTRQNLVFDFSHELAPDSIIGKWDSTEYLGISPAIKGLFKWNSAKQLVFSPSAGFRPATEYQLSPNTNLLRFSGGRLSLEATVLRFRTASLQLTGMQTWWTLSQGSTEALCLNTSIHFNYEVDPQLLAPLISGEINGRKVQVSVPAQAPSSTLVIRADGISRAEAMDGTFSVRIQQGLKCSACGLEANQLHYMSGFKAVSSLEITQTESDYENGEGIIRIYTNQPVMMAGIEALLRVKPATSFRIDALESGLILRGAFSAGNSYEVNFSGALQGMLGGTLGQDFSSSVSFGEQEPGIAFTSGKGMYLSSKGSRKIGLQIINIPKVKVSVYKIFENNLLAFTNNNRYEDWYGEDEGSTFVYNDYDLERFGNKILEQEYEVKDLPLQDGIRLLSLDFDDEMPFRGVYLVSARSTESQWIKASKLVSVSDIGLMARTGLDQVWVFANSVKNATFLQNISVSLVSANNQVLFTGTTNGEGMVKFEGLHSRFRDFRPAMITARSGNDFNYMLLDDTRVETSRFETGGYREQPGGLMAFLYGDREIYRPGETIHSHVIVRNRAWKAQSGMPVKFKLILPNGRELSTQRKTLNAQGAASQDFALAPGTVTGSYTLELYSANDVLLHSKSISVEEFMPDRISVKASTSKDNYLPGDSIQVSGEAANLFGTAAAARKYEVQFSLSKSLFQPKGYEAYNFSIMGLDQVSLPSVFREGKTGENGRFRESMYLDPVYRETGMLQGKAFVTVFDETGRPVNRVAPFEVETQQVFFGTRTSEYYAGVGQALQMGIVSLNSKGQAVPVTARVRLLKINYHNVLKRNYSDRLYFVSQKEERIIQDRVVSTGGRELQLPFTPTESGEYVLRVSLPGSERYVQQSFYAYGRGFTGSNAFAVNTEGTIDITADREVYHPGENAKLLFKTPFNGKLLVTVEQNEVIRHYFLVTDKKTAELVLPVEREYLPNVYITATIFRKLEDSFVPLTVAHGVVPLLVESGQNRIPLSITAAARSRANTRQQITVKTTPGKEVELTIAVVDEGILQLRNSKSPDPYAFFYQKKALMVDGYDLYPFLLPELKLRRSSSGGDGYDLAKRVNPITSKRVKLVSAWSGILKTNAGGTASYTMDIPAFSGDLRIMAVAYQDQAFGSAEAHMKVADPVVISSALPRFASPGDTVEVPVTFSNTTMQTISAQAEVSGGGVLQVAGGGSRALQLSPGQEQRFLYKIIAAKGTGEGSFTVKVKHGHETYQDKTELSVRQPAGLQRRSGSGSISGGSTANIDLQFGFTPATAEAELIVSKSPLLAFADHMKYLLDYPHGCAEQSISVSFPQIYYGDLAKSISNRPGHPINVQGNVQACITKILSLQHYNGGIVTWPGSSSGNAWTSAYAAHFLSEARQAGYEVNEKGFEKLLDYLQKQAREKTYEELWYTQPGNTIVSRKVPSKAIFYSLYVLALNNKADRSSMNYYKSKSAELALDSKYMLAACYLAIGDRRTYTELLPKRFEGEQSQSSTGGSFYSYIRDMAMALNALLQTDPDHPQVGELVRMLSAELKNRTWLNTQERALSFLALGKFSRKAAQSEITATVSTEKGSPYRFDGKDLVIRKGISDQRIRINTQGKGNLYYFWNSSGLSVDGAYVQEDKNLKVRKTFFNRNGQEISGRIFRQNELIVVRISLENLSRSFIENIVVSDLLPAGFEIENPRISSIPDLDWIKNNSASEHIDLRDDRIHIYTGLGTQPQYFYYVVRAVSPGNYVMGPVSADAMYSGEYHSMHGSGRVQIK